MTYRAVSIEGLPHVEAADLYESGEPDASAGYWA